MSLLLKDNPQEIYEYFTKSLSKTESIFLIGYYYFNNNSILSTNKEIRKYKIIGQQFLTFSLNNPLSYKRYNYKDENISLSLNDFYSDTDTINYSVNKEYLIQKTCAFDIAKIDQQSSSLNKNLNSPIKFTIEDNMENISKSQVCTNNELQALEDKLNRTMNKMKPYDKENFLKYIKLFFKGIPSILNLDHLSPIEYTYVNKVKYNDFEEPLKLSKKYDGLWINNNEAKEDLRFLIQMIQLLVNVGGLIFISYPYCKKGYKIYEDGTLVACNRDSFLNLINRFNCKSNVPYLKVYSSWEQTYIDQNNGKTIKTFNVVLIKLKDAQPVIINNEKQAEEEVLKQNISADSEDVSVTLTTTNEDEANEVLTKKQTDTENYKLFKSKFKKASKILNFSSLSPHEENILRRLPFFKNIGPSIMYGGIWVNDIYSTLSLEDLYTKINLLSKILLKDGLMYLSFPYYDTTNIIESNKIKSLSFNSDSFEFFFIEHDFSSLEIADNWISEYYPDRFKKDKIKSFNLILKKISSDN